MTVDGVTHEVITGKLISIVDEMAIVLARASMSPVVYEVLDFACGLCDGRGDLVAQTNGITIFTGTFSRQVHFIIGRFGGDMRPGDVFLTNDPFEGGTHACDFAIIRPIFVAASIIAYAIAVAHLLDVGGAVAGSLPPDATSVFQEGLRLSGIRLARDDKLIEDVIRIVTENVRLPVLVMGDINAELAAVRIAERRVLEAVECYGAATLDGTFRRLIASSEGVLADHHIAIRHYADAETLALGAYRIVMHDFGPANPKSQAAAQRLVGLYEAWGRPDQAAKFRTRAVTAPAA